MNYNHDDFILKNKFYQLIENKKTEIKRNLNIEYTNIQKKNIQLDIIHPILDQLKINNDLQKTFNFINIINNLIFNRQINCYHIDDILNEDFNKTIACFKDLIIKIDNLPNKDIKKSFKEKILSELVNKMNLITLTITLTNSLCILKEVSGNDELNEDIKKIKSRLRNSLFSFLEEKDLKDNTSSDQLNFIFTRIIDAYIDYYKLIKIKKKAEDIRDEIDAFTLELYNIFSSNDDKEKREKVYFHHKTASSIIIENFKKLYSFTKCKLLKLVIKNIEKRKDEKEYKKREEAKREYEEKEERKRKEKNQYKKEEYKKQENKKEENKENIYIKNIFDNLKDNERKIMDEVNRADVISNEILKKLFLIEKYIIYISDEFKTAGLMSKPAEGIDKKYIFPKKFETKEDEPKEKPKEEPKTSPETKDTQLSLYLKGKGFTFFQSFLSNNMLYITNKKFIITGLNLLINVKIDPLLMEPEFYSLKSIENFDDWNKSNKPQLSELFDEWIKKKCNRIYAIRNVLEYIRNNLK